VKLKKYQNKAAETEAQIDDQIRERMSTHGRVLHHAIGICTEAGEIQDALKKFIFYGKEWPQENLEEELGDLMWYAAGLANTINVHLSSILDQNIEKLQQHRYPEGFTEEAAQKRADKQQSSKIGQVYQKGNDYLTICADQVFSKDAQPNPFTLGCKWDYQAREWDVSLQLSDGDTFEISKESLEEWTLVTPTKKGAVPVKE